MLIKSLFAEFCILALGLFIIDGNDHPAKDVLYAAGILLFLIRLFTWGGGKQNNKKPIKK